MQAERVSRPGVVLFFASFFLTSRGAGDTTAASFTLHTHTRTYLHKHTIAHPWSTRPSRPRCAAGGAQAGGERGQRFADRSTARAVAAPCLSSRSAPPVPTLPRRLPAHPASSPGRWRTPRTHRIDPHPRSFRSHTLFFFSTHPHSSSRPAPRRPHPRPPRPPPPASTGRTSWTRRTRWPKRRRSGRRQVRRREAESGGRRRSLPRLSLQF